MYKHVTVAQANLTDPRTCPEMIDTIIQQCLMHSRPVYIEVPTDMVAVAVNAERLKSKIEPVVMVSSDSETSALSLILDSIYASKQPMIFVDGESRAYGILDRVHELFTSTRWLTWTSTFGKSCVDESLPNVHGIWKGERWAHESEKLFVASCDLILCFGPHFSLTNSYGFSTIPDPKKSIVFAADRVEVFGRSFRDVPCRQVLSRLLQELDISRIPAGTASSVSKAHSVTTTSDQPDRLITQALFYKHFNNFLRPSDIILAETGTAGYGSRDFDLPSHTMLLKPVTWLSIGYMLPAAQGAALAQRELYEAGMWHQPFSNPVPRTILLIGDGSFQMTVQELSTIIREKLNVFIVLINNDGYTIERCLHGWDCQYNDVASWKYLMAPFFFGAEKSGNTGYDARTIGDVRTWKELDEVLDTEKEEKSASLRMIEVFMDREDAPDYLRSSLEEQKRESQNGA